MHCSNASFSDATERCRRKRSKHRRLECPTHISDWCTVAVHHEKHPGMSEQILGFPPVVSSPESGAIAVELGTADGGYALGQVGTVDAFTDSTPVCSSASSPLGLEAMQKE